MAEAYDPQPYLDIASSAEKYAHSIASAYQGYGESKASAEVGSALSIASYWESRAGDIVSSVKSLASSYVGEYAPHHETATVTESAVQVTTTDMTSPTFRQDDVTETKPATTASSSPEQFTGAAMVILPEIGSICLIGLGWLIGTAALVL